MAEETTWNGFTDPFNTRNTSGLVMSTTGYWGWSWDEAGHRSNSTQALTDGPAGTFPAGNSLDETVTDSPVLVSPEDPFLPWNNPENVISLATFLLIEKISMCGVNPVLFLIGVPTNILNCIVFARQGLRDRMNFLLFSLSLVDMAYVALFFMVGSYCLVGEITPGYEEWWKYFARKYFTGLYRGFLYTSGCLTMVIALERCVCVALPLKVATLIKTRTVAILVFAILALIQAACCLYPLELEIGSMVDPDTGKVLYFLTLTQFYFDNRLLYNIVENTFLMIVIPFFTFIVVSAATAVTVVKLKRAVTWRETSGCDSAISKRQIALAKMLVVVSCVYILTAAPNLALGLSRLTVPGFLPSDRFANIFLASHLLYLMLAMFNSSVNFFIYVSRSSRYRKELRRLFLCGRQDGRFESSKPASQGIPKGENSASLPAFNPAGSVPGHSYPD